MNQDNLSFISRTMELTSGHESWRLKVTSSAMTTDRKRKYKCVFRCIPSFGINTVSEDPSKTLKFHFIQWRFIHSSYFQCACQKVKQSLAGMSPLGIRSDDEKKTFFVCGRVKLRCGIIMCC